MIMNEVHKRLGKWGRYQAYVVALLFIPGFLGGCHTLISSFTLAAPENRCFVPGFDDVNNASYDSPFINNLTRFLYSDAKTQAGKLAYCSYCPYNETAIIQNVSCSSSSARACDHGRVFDKSQYTSTLSMQFDMVCERSWNRELLRSLFMLGVLTGAALSGIISDKIGRKRTFVICSLLEMVVFNVVTLVKNYYVYCILQFVGAALQYGTYLTGFIIAMEVIDGYPRTITGVGFQGYFTIGYLYVGFMAYLIRDWQWLQFSVSILTFLYLPYHWLLPESIRWLLIKGKRREAQITLEKACKMNRVSVYQLPDNVEMDITKGDKPKSKASAWDLFRNKKLAVYTIVIFFTWLVCSLTYYGLSLNTADLPGDDYVNFILSGIVELPGLIVCIPMMERIGRKPTMIILLASSGIACVISGVLPSKYPGAVVATAVIGKMCIAAAFAGIYNYSAEIYPTVLRNTGTGLSSLFARIGSFCAPQIHLLSYYVDHWLPIVIYGTFALAAAFTDFLLPETRGRQMPETLEDTLRLEKKSLPKKPGDTSKRLVDTTDSNYDT